VRAPLIVRYDSDADGTATTLAAQARALAARGYTCVPVRAVSARPRSFAIVLHGPPTAELEATLPELPITVYLSPGTPAALPDGRFELGATTRERLLRARPITALVALCAAKRSVEEITGRAVTSFALPAAGYARACVQAARHAGFETAVAPGAVRRPHPFELPIITPRELWQRL
jgi:hypothetical protein